MALIFWEEKFHDLSICMWGSNVSQCLDHQARTQTVIGKTLSEVARIVHVIHLEANYFSFLFCGAAFSKGLAPSP